MGHKSPILWKLTSGSYDKQFSSDKDARVGVYDNLDPWIVTSGTSGVSLCCRSQQLSQRARLLRTIGKIIFLLQQSLVAADLQLVWMSLKPSLRIAPSVSTFVVLNSLLCLVLEVALVKSDFEACLRMLPHYLNIRPSVAILLKALQRSILYSLLLPSSNRR